MPLSKHLNQESSKLSNGSIIKFLLKFLGVIKLKIPIQMPYSFIQLRIQEGERQRAQCGP